MADFIEFPDCCGIIILKGFRGGHPGSDPDHCMKPTEVNEFLQKMEREFYGKRSGLMVTLSQPQQDRIGSVFKDRKWFLMLSEHMNPRTGVQLYTWFRDLNATKLREKRIFGRT